MPIAIVPVPKKYSGPIQKKKLKKKDGKTVSDKDKSLISRAYSIARGVVGPGGAAISDVDIRNALKKIINAKNKKGKPHLKKGGKAKKMKA
jgi:hypothetical protein